MERILNKEKGRRYGQMDRSMRDGGEMGKLMEKGGLYVLVGIINW